MVVTRSAAAAGTTPAAKLPRTRAAAAASANKSAAVPPATPQTGSKTPAEKSKRTRARLEPDHSADLSKASVSAKLETAAVTPARTDDETAALGKAVQVTTTKPRTTNGYATVACVRVGPRGLLSCVSSLWGAQTFRTHDEKDFLTVRLKRMESLHGPCDTLIVDRHRPRAKDGPVEGWPEKVRDPRGKEVNFRFPLSRLSAVDICNGTVKLEFLRKGGGSEPLRGGPLVVLQFHKATTADRTQDLHSLPAPALN